MSKRKRSIARTATNLVWRGGVLGLFLVVAAVLVFFSLGYRINFASRALEQTGAISISGDEAGLSVYLDGTLVASKLPYVATALTPSTTHSVRITKDQYQTWQQTVNVSPGLVTNLGPVDLWLEKPPVKAVTDTTSLTSCMNKKPLRADELIVNGGEIRSGANLITRFSSPITEACWFRDTNHVVYATDKTISIIDVSVSAISLIFSSDQTIIHLDTDRSSKTVFVQFGDKTWKHVTVAND